jgi:DCC1-like thiol-disulfide oxidoreductase
MVVKISSSRGHIEQIRVETAVARLGLDGSAVADLPPPCRFRNLDSSVPMMLSNLSNRCGSITIRSVAGVKDVRRRLHAVDAGGRLHVGADCAIAIWLRTPGDAWLGRVLSLPVIHPIARIGYDRFADLLYAWNRRQGRW